MCLYSCLTAILGLMPLLSFDGFKTLDAGLNLSAFSAKDCKFTWSRWLNTWFVRFCQSSFVMQVLASSWEETHGSNIRAISTKKMSLALRESEYPPPGPRTDVTNFVSRRDRKIFSSLAVEMHCRSANLTSDTGASAWRTVKSIIAAMAILLLDESGMRN